MPLVDLVDDSFLVADPRVVAALVHDPAVPERWWPDLRLSVSQDRDEAGLRWIVTGTLVGTAEVWLEPRGDGVMVHVYLRADPAGPARWQSARGAAGRYGVRETRRRARQVKLALWAMKDALEEGRPVGTGRTEAPPGRGDSDLVTGIRRRR